MKCARLLAPALVVASLSAGAQNPSDGISKYSFTISAAQTWTDTGVDLAAGDALTFTAEAKFDGENSCSPIGTATADSAAKLPLSSAPAGALIAKTSEHGDAALVGSAGNLKADSAGHLFIGVNQVAPSNCSFVVKVQIASVQVSPAQNANPATGNATPGNTPAQNAAAPNATDAAQHPALKEQLSSAAQVWLKGQFGNSSSSGSAQSSNAVSGNEAASASASTGLKLPTVILDADLRQHIDSLPRRVHDHAGNQGDMVNFVVVGSQESMQAAFDAANWHVADVDSKEAGLKAVLDTYQKKEYLQMPMSHLYLFDRMQDFGYEQAQAYAVVASRHHFRVWKAPFTWNDQVVWVGAATHDIGFEKDIRTGKLTHKIDPDVDSERANLADGLDKSGKAKNMTYYLPPNPVQDAKNASGGGYHSDGRLLVVFLK
jgi:LssY C-terminus